MHISTYYSDFIYTKNAPILILNNYTKQSTILFHRKYIHAINEHRLSTNYMITIIILLYANYTNDIRISIYIYLYKIIKYNILNPS